VPWVKVPINYTTQRDLLHHLSSPSSSLFKTVSYIEVSFMRHNTNELHDIRF
jgi:hypothetical protein